MGLTVLVKTNGALIGMALPLALVMLGRPAAWRAYVRPLGVACLVGLLPVPLLLLGMGAVMHQIVDHTRGADPGGGGSLLATNAVTVAGWLESYVGNRFLLLVGAGAVLALVFRQAGLLFAALLGLAVLLVIAAISSPIFARRLLLPAFPAFLLAAYAIERAGYLVAWASRTLGPGRERARLAVGVGVAVVGLVLALGERADLAMTIVRSPAEAQIPGSEHLQYFENWYALYGLGQVAEELRAQGRERPVTVLVPPASRENRVMVPYAALRYFLRRDRRSGSSRRRRSGGRRTSASFGGSRATARRSWWSTAATRWRPGCRTTSRPTRASSSGGWRRISRGARGASHPATAGAELAEPVSAGRVAE